MKYRIWLSVFTVLALTLIVGASHLVQAQQSTAFTYQGWLQHEADYFSATCSFDFRLFDAAVAGNQLGSTISKTGVTVRNGYFSVSLDFGPVFTSNASRYLEISQVNCGHPGDPIDLSGRVPLNQTIYTNYAQLADTADSVNWADITNKPPDFSDDSDDGVFITCTNNQTLYWAGGGWACTNVLSDHGALTGLANDGHPQYLLIDGTRAMSGSLNLASHQLTNLPRGNAPGEPTTYEQAVKTGDPIGGDLDGGYGMVITVTAIQGQPVTNTVPITNQVFTWDGGQWAPADPQAGGPAGGDLDDTYPNPTVAGLQGRPVNPATPLDKQVLSWDGSSWQPTDAVSIGDVAGGDLAGTYPDPTVDGIQGRSVSSSLPGDKQVLTWNDVGQRWEAADPQTVGSAGGDLYGSYPDPGVDALQGKPVSGSSPNNQQVLTWTGSQWAPADVTHLQGELVADVDPATNQILAWNDSSSQWEPAEVTSLQGRPVAAGTPGDAQVLVWSGSEWAATNVLKAGDAAGGDLNGTYPNPQLNPNTVMMDELNIPMGYGAGTGQFSSGDTSVDLFIMPAGTGFEPTSEGQCLVTVSAYLKNTTSGVADDNPSPDLRTAKQVGTGPASHDGDQPVRFAQDDVTKYQSTMASAGFVWNIGPADLNQTVKFGCYILDPPGDWDNDEAAYCRVSYLCQ